jgi:iron complex outermembrane receptor protein
MPTLLHQLKKTGFFIALVLFLQNAAAQTGEIKGNVRDKEGKSVISANLALKGTTYGATTDGNGTYQFTNIPAGNYTIVFSNVGYKPFSKKISIKAAEVVQLDIEAETDVSQLQTVEVTGRKETSYKNDKSFSASKIEMAIKDIPQSISTVTKELIQDRQALRLKDIVQNVAGINEFSVYDDITMRGFRNSGSGGRLMNGLRTYNNFWTSPLLVNIERVEFIKGPASAVFANASPGGTVNMVTKKPLDESRQSVSFSTGSFSTFRVQSDFTGPLNDDKTLLYRLNLGYENAESFRDQVFNKSFVVAPSVSFLPREGTRFNADLVYTNQHTILDRGRTIVQGTKDLFATPLNFNVAQPGDYLKQQNLALTLSFSQELSKNIAFNASYMKFRYDELLNEHVHAAYITPDSIMMAFTDRTTKFNGNNLTAYLTFKFNTSRLQHTLLAGYDYIDGYNISYNRSAIGLANGVADLSLKNPYWRKQPIESYTYDPSRNYSSGNRYKTQGVYVQDLVQINRFQFLLSLRQEFYKYPVTSFSFAGSNIPEAREQNALLPRIGITYTLTNNINLYATYATGFEPQAGGTLSNPATGGPFDPLTSDLLEAGAKGEFFNSRLFAGVAIYQIRQNNVLVNANDPSRPDLLKQRGQERARGFELEASGRILPNLSVQVNYAFNEALITEDAENDVNKRVGLAKENAPKHSSGSWIKYTIRKGTFSGLGFGLGHSQVSERETFDRTLQLPAYVVFNGGIYYQVKRLQLSVNLNNLADKKYISGGYNYERNFPGAPRNFLLNVGYTF